MPRPGELPGSEPSPPCYGDILNDTFASAVGASPETEPDLFGYA